MLFVRFVVEILTFGCGSAAQGSVVSPFLNVWNDWNLLNDWNPRNAVIFCFNECIANVALASVASL